MTQNLRYVPKAEDGYSKSVAVTQNGEKYYHYPNLDSGSPAEYGLLYNWYAATNGENSSTDNQGDGEENEGPDNLQGICPVGWHLPSDKEWHDLEKEITEAQKDKYSSGEPAIWSDVDWIYNSSVGTHGAKMKSTTAVNDTPTNGLSNPAQDGGFDVLLVGVVLGGDVVMFGMGCGIWSASSSGYNGGNQPAAWGRTFANSMDAVQRFRDVRSHLMSVRCKRNQPFSPQ
jgi:uncharacterized protein (TIGR02145 family)